MYPWKLFLKRMVYLLLTYLLLRVIFVAANPNLLTGLSIKDVCVAFIMGERFDAWSVFWINVPLLICAWLPGRWQAKVWLQRLQLLWILLTGFVVMWINLTDTELYKFTGKRVTVEWLRLQQDLKHQTVSLVIYYWWLMFAGLVVLAIMAKLWPKWRPNGSVLDWSKGVAPGIVISAFYILGMRGGWQLKPLNFAHAYSYGSPQVATIAMNSTFSFIRSRDLQFDSLNVRFFKGNEAERDQILAEISAPRSDLHGLYKNYNVMVILVESLAAEFVGILNDGKGYTPFLDELSQRGGKLFVNAFANGRRSIEAVPSVVCGLPSLMGEAFILSPYQGIELHCLPHLATAAGYESHFFHGAYNGSMFFDTFSSRAGFKHFHGFSEFNQKDGDDGHWGAFDEPFLQYTVEQLNKSAKPFFATAFTLTSHNPYRIPEIYKGKFPKGELEIHESIGYVDYALRKFFEAASKTDWYTNTIFIITGDHTQKSVDKKYQNLTGFYRVPLWIYLPEESMPVNSAKLVQHLDILPTVIDLLGWDQAPRLKFGQSLLSRTPGVVFNGLGYGYWLLQDERQAKYMLEANQFTLSKFDKTSWQTDDRQESDATAEKTEQALKAIIDYFNWGVSSNSLYK